GEPLREVVEDDVMLPRLFLALRSPVFGSEEYWAASICSAILGMRNGSRLHRSLVRERQVASSASAFTFDLTKGSDLLVVDVTARPGTTAEQLELEVGRELDIMHERGVTDNEVERARALVETSLVSALQSAGSRADKLSMYANYFRKPELVNQELDSYRAVTRDSVNAFAQERLGRNNRA